MKKIISSLVSLLFIVSCYSQDITHSPLAASGDKPNTVILSHHAYTSCFSKDTNTPLWVSWELTPALLADPVASRTDEFLPDPMLGSDSPVSGDYTGSGYDRGHMAPAADFKWSTTAMRESFYMSNICPQDHILNGEGPWLGLEKQCRAWGKHYTRMIIVAGPVFGQEPKYIGKERKVAVPDAFFKVVLKVFKNKVYTIAFIIPNRSLDSEGSFFKYACTIADVEERTGLDIFPLLAEGYQQELDRKSDIKDWSYYLIPFNR